MTQYYVKVPVNAIFGMLLEVVIVGHVLNFDVYTVNIEVTCSLAGFAGLISSCINLASFPVIMSTVITQLHFLFL